MLVTTISPKYIWIDVEKIVQDIGQGAQQTAMKLGLTSVLIKL